MGTNGTPPPAGVSPHDRVQSVGRFLLEMAARAQATNAPSIELSLATVQGLAQDLVVSVMALEKP